MKLSFRAPRDIIHLALGQLKQDGIVHPEAAFNPTAPMDLRREVAYYDRDFLYRLGRTSAEGRLIASAVNLLRDSNLIAPSAAYDEQAFQQHRKTVKQRFSGSWTSLSPAMERLLYTLTSLRRPSHLIELGSFWGYTLAWFAGPCLGPHAVYSAQRVIGIDINAAATRRAQANFAALGHIECLQLLAEDAHTALQRIPGPFDAVYIEAKGDTDPDCYLSLLKDIYDRLAPGAWVLAHDNLDWEFAGEMARYLPFVRDGNRFAHSIAFEIDSCGLELSIR